MSVKKVFCVIPAYNEEKNISKVIEDVCTKVDAVVVVVDGGTDNTYNVAINTKEKMERVCSNIYVLKHLINRGQGAALQTGNVFALKNGADLVVHFDADCQFLSEEIKNVVSPIIEDEVDVVFGSRFLDKKSKIPWFKENVVFRIARFFNKVFLGVNLTDPQSGFRAMNKKSLLMVKIEQDKMAHCSEILSKVVKANLKIKEVPVTVIYNEYGQKLSGGLKIIKDIFFSKIFN